LPEHAGAGLAAIALPDLVRTVEERIDVCARGRPEPGGKRNVHSLQVALTHQPEREPPLVGDDDR
jgi:hypothetical protein